jgi:zinc transporter ZupT
MSINPRLQDGVYDLNLIKEIHEHMDDMERVIGSFHDQVAFATDRWMRRHRDLPDTTAGDVVPVSLVIPVAMDSFVDGLLIGIASALQFRAGLVLALANMMEMGFLGMAYSLRISRCTGSSVMVRNVALFSPPLIMTVAAGLGALVAHGARQIPALFVSFVGFGIVALLALVCGELLIEARENQGEATYWYVQLCLFAGVYIVLVGH